MHYVLWPWTWHGITAHGGGGGPSASHVTDRHILTILVAPYATKNDNLNWKPQEKQSQEERMPSTTLRSQTWSYVLALWQKWVLTLQKGFLFNHTIPFLTKRFWKVIVWFHRNHYCTVWETCIHSPERGNNTYFSPKGQCPGEKRSSADRSAKTRLDAKDQCSSVCSPAVQQLWRTKLVEFGACKNSQSQSNRLDTREFVFWGAWRRDCRAWEDFSCVGEILTPAATELIFLPPSSHFSAEANWLELRQESLVAVLSVLVKIIPRHPAVSATGMLLPWARNEFALDPIQQKRNLRCFVPVCTSSFPCYEACDLIEGT